MRVACISDFHGQLPPTPRDVDLVLIAVISSSRMFPIRSAGNMFKQISFLENQFIPWLNRIDASIPVVLTAGNHDGIFEYSNNHLLPKLPCHVLIEGCTEILGLKIFGFAYQLPFNDWFFNIEESEIAQKLKKVPDDMDVFLLHCPPYKIGDQADAYKNYPARHIGSKAILDKVNQSPKLKLIVFGHCHEGYGKYLIDEKVFVNASYMRNKGGHNETIVVNLNF